jgi:DNA polymerase elongation subunit (family B)
MVYVDLFFEELSKGYKIYGIKRRGELEVLSNVHYPWFAVYVPKDMVQKAVEEITKTVPGVVGAEPIDITKRIPLLPADVRHIPRLDYRMIRVYSEKKEYVPNQAKAIIRSLGSNVYAGVYNIVYPIRVSFDLDVKYFHPKCPILYQPNSELEQLASEVIEGNKDLRVMAFDIEVATQPGRFPRPGDPIISIQYGVMRLDDPDFYTEEWIKDNIVVLTAKSLKESEDLVAEFLKIIDKERPDILVGYNSAAFDVRYMIPFLRHPRLVVPDPHHISVGDRVYPHVDLMEVRDSMGSTLGIRSQRALALDDVVKELVRDNKQLKWLETSKYMEAEEKLDHSRIVLEWERRTELFYHYTMADVYLTLILARLWTPTLMLLSALVQTPLTSLTRLNTGQIAEYNVVHWLEMLGFEPVVEERSKEFRKVLSLGTFEEIVEDGWRELFMKGKVYVRTYGVFEKIVEGDFAQLYPTLMANESLDPTALRAWKIASIDNPFKVTIFSDPLFRGLASGKPAYLLAKKVTPVLLGTPPESKTGEVKKAADHMKPTDIYYVVSTYGPVSFILYKMFTMRRITKKFKKRAKEEGRPELLAPDQAVKILNNATYGGFSKRRGFINQVLSGYIFWKTLKILYDVIEYAEKKLGLEVTYGDTDSVFIKCKVDEARKMYPDASCDTDACMKWFSEHVLPILDSFVKEKYGKEFTIEFEDAFGMCIYPKVKKGESASKKSYICANAEGEDLKVVVFKGDFYKAMAPEAIRERLAEFYETIIREKPRSSVGVERIMREFLSKAPLHKLFVKKTVDNFRSEKQENKEDKKYVVKLKNLNKNWHFAALHLAYAWNLPGVLVAFKNQVGKDTYIVSYSVDAVEVLSTGSLMPLFLPSNEPKDFILYIDDDGERVKVHKVKVKSYEKISHREGDAIKETGYRVTVVYKEEWLTREELINLAVESMRRYIIDDISRKLLPALHKIYGGLLDGFIQGVRT